MTFPGSGRSWPQNSKHVETTPSSGHTHTRVHAHTHTLHNYDLGAWRPAGTLPACRERKMSKAPSSCPTFQLIGSKKKYMCAQTLEDVHLWKAVFGRPTFSETGWTEWNGTVKVHLPPLAQPTLLIIGQFGFVVGKSSEFVHSNYVCAQTRCRRVEASIPDCQLMFFFIGPTS